MALKKTTFFAPRPLPLQSPTSPPRSIPPPPIILSQKHCQISISIPLKTAKMAEMPLESASPCPPDCPLSIEATPHFGPNSPSPSSSPPLPDTFSTIRRNCERHLRRLERYRKARSFCSLAEMDDPKEGREEDKNADERQFADLRGKMIEAFENDMALLAKLLSLGDSLRELRQRQAGMEGKGPPGQEGEEEEEKRGDQLTQMERKFGRNEPMAVYGRQRRQRNPIPAEFGAPQEVTRLFVRQGDEDEGGEEEEEQETRGPSVQYFSRKNSVLRIPIPPRASNRAFARCLRGGPKRRGPAAVAPVEMDSGHSSDSEGGHRQSPPPAPPPLPPNSRFSTLSSGLSTQSSMSGLSNRGGQKEQK